MNAYEISVVVQVASESGIENARQAVEDRLRDLIAQDARWADRAAAAGGALTGYRVAWVGNVADLYAEGKAPEAVQRQRRPVLAKASPAHARDAGLGESDALTGAAEVSERLAETFAGTAQRLAESGRRTRIIGEPDE